MAGAKTFFPVDIEILDFSERFELSYEEGQKEIVLSDGEKITAEI